MAMSKVSWQVSSWLLRKHYRMHFLSIIRIAQLQYRGLFLWNTRLAIISNTIISPALVVITYYLIVRGTTEIPAGTLLFSVAIVAGGSTAASAVLQSSSNDVAFGTQDARNMSIMPIALQDVILLTSLIPVVTLTISSATAVAFILGDIELHPNLLWIAFALPISAISLVLFSAVIGLIPLIQRDWISGVLLINGIVLAGSGAIIPRSSLAGEISWISSLVPTAHVLPAIRDMLEGSWSAKSFWSQMALECSVMAGYSIVLSCVTSTTVWRKK